LAPAKRNQVDPSTSTINPIPQYTRIISQNKTNSPNKKRHQSANNTTLPAPKPNNNSHRSNIP
jgi:hypothetical protein